MARRRAVPASAVQAVVRAAVAVAAAVVRVAAVPAAAAAAVRAVEGESMVTPTTTQGTQLSPEQIGYLSAGPGRAAETALARLLDAGLVRVSRDGRVSAVHQYGHHRNTPVEARMHKSVQTPVSFNKVVKTAAYSNEMQALHRQLLSDNLMRKARRRAEAWWVFFGAAGLMTVLGFLLPGFFIGAVGFLAIGFWARGSSPVTRAGKAVLKNVTASDRVLAVALYGFAGNVASQKVGDLFELSQSVVKMIPLKRKKKSGSRGGGGCGAAGSSCGSGCGSSSCGSSSSSCSSSSGSSCSSGGSSCGGGGGGGS
ncbi:TIGR04222 domain-containing membrane protein [Lentzea sp. NPDC054927]